MCLERRGIVQQIFEKHFNNHLKCLYFIQNKEKLRVGTLEFIFQTQSLMQPNVLLFTYEKLLPTISLISKFYLSVILSK